MSFGIDDAPRMILGRSEAIPVIAGLQTKLSDAEGRGADKLFFDDLLTFIKQWKVIGSLLRGDNFWQLGTARIWATPISYGSSTLAGVSASLDLLKMVILSEGKMAWNKMENQRLANAFYAADEKLQWLVGDYLDQLNRQDHLRYESFLRILSHV